MKKTVFIVIGILLFLASIPVLIYWKGWSSDPAVKVISTSLEPGTPGLGETAMIKVEVLVPWHRKMNDLVELKLPEFVQRIDGGSIKEKGFELNGRRYEATAFIQPVSEGEFKEMEILLHFTPDKKGGNSEVKSQLPVIKVTLDENASGIKPAGELDSSVFKTEEEDAAKSNVLWVVLLVLILLGFVGLIFLKKQKVRALTLQERSLKAIREMDFIHTKPEEFYVKLSDILRGYIEETYEIKALEMSGTEFVNRIRFSKVFSEDEKIKLKNFVDTSELIKFAKADATQDMMKNAAQSAVVFVNSMKQQEEAS